ncbi:DNA translocase FtsK [Bacteriovorax sp. Seq25_V]|uniref:DNA translocase FtsK n=1 Tax=Bacteriovorax sp. Seq25_V TaxID=1201288 RepID=UPI00038A1828|nr:DNA translocase FtsK [Bacteriovorax sp. Seq25_V]EQC44672.1 FtsK/SpoIIIE family protein [Bacteriovorax sp. Seq25_V]
MKRNILKSQLFLLFVMTIFSFVTFYYGNDLPDNSFAITSAGSGNIITYYFFSLVTYVSYYTGPWSIVPFMIFAFCFTFIYDKRTFMVDTLNFFALIFFFSTAVYFAYPSALGRGIYFFLHDFFEPLWLGLYCFTSLILFLVGTFRSSFKDTLQHAFVAVKSIPSKYRAVNEKVKSLPFLQKSEGVHTPSVENKVSSLLKSKTSEKPLFLSQPDDKKSSVEKIDDKESRFKKFVPSIFNKSDSTDESSDEVVAAKEEKSFTQVFGPKSDNVNENLENASNELDADTGVAPRREPQVRMVSDIKTLNKFADTSSDNKYFNIVETLSETREAKQNREPDSEYFEQIIGLLEAKLNEFKIEGNIVNVLKGPVVDTFEFKPGAGVKVSKISNATEDLSLALYGVPIRVVPSMMGRDTVGIEVPRNPREIIYLDEVLNSDDFQKSKYGLPIAMGKDAFGEPFVIDLASCPHMLVAGATGAGKSVFINSLLVSLLIKKSPKKMKLILIDPKQLELALYSKLPHLVMPVITDAKTASISLLWAVQEMERRYSILREFGVRNISGFNDKLEKATPSMLANIHQFYEDSGAEDYELPYLVIIVDEFADLILTKAGKEIENNIARLAAKARAAGIHIILATQRPSVDVITGVIKSNFPTRVSFRVTSQTDSRTILDKMGAERLLGKGDMLYKHGISTQRVHSSYVNEDEIEALTNKLEDIPCEFNTNAMDFLESGGEVETDDYTYGSHIPSSSDSADDDMYGEALKIVVESRSASASMLQRRLRIGYNRAANLVEEMERRGVVGPAQGSKPRKVLHSGDDAQF